MRRSLIHLAGAAACLLLWTGCGVDVSPGAQGPGQRCFSDDDCAPELVCSGRICLPRAGIVLVDMTGGDMGPNPDMPPTDMPPDMPPVDMDMPPDLPDMPPIDFGQVCMLGQPNRCEDAQVYVECVAIPGDANGREVRRGCPQGTRCESGACVESCIDRDRDGFFENCAPFDCNDGRRDISPRAQELCGDNIDNNCDRRVDEGCGTCCAGGCGPNEFCSECACQPFEPAFCEFQNQPCFNEDEFQNGFYCIDIFQTGQPRCVGLCDPAAPNPDATCPQSGTICAFGSASSGEPGVCLSTCTQDQGCGIPGFGCGLYDAPQVEGVCLGVNPNNRIGDRCDPERSFFDCEEGAVCLEQGPGGGRCVQSCRPFSLPDNASDCGNAGHCLPLFEGLGICRPDNTATGIGQTCFPEGTMCRQDAVFCLADDAGQNTCQQLCRTNTSGDCPAGMFCNPDLFGEDQGVGRCTVLGP